MKMDFNPVPENITPAQKKGLASIKKLSIEFESFFMQEVIKSMRNTVPKDGYLNGGNAEKIFESMQDEQLAQQFAERGDSGLSQAIYKDMSRKYLESNHARETEASK